ncbi:MAG: hypothetical protein ACE5R6_16765 [Candidatus Heimdallarchaeota archaeon]
MVLIKTIVCPQCKEKLIFIIKEENVGNGPLFSLACLHNNGARVLIATFDSHLFLRKATCLEIQHSQD